MATFAVTTEHGPGWDDSRPIREQRDWTAHADFMDGLVADGTIIIGGPLGDGSQTLHAVQAASEDESRMRFAADPWAAADMLHLWSIRPWALWLDSRSQPP